MFSSFPSVHMSNARRRRTEDRMAVLFMGIVVVNLICHFPRILLNFYEMMVIEEAMACAAVGKRAFAVWAQVGRKEEIWSTKVFARIH
jgi:hypothetical protein